MQRRLGPLALACVSLVVLATPGSADSAVPPAPTAQITSVDFLKNKDVVRDQLGADPQLVNFDGDSVEWKISPTDANATAKNWPVVYAKRKYIELTAGFKLTNVKAGTSVTFNGELKIGSNSAKNFTDTAKVAADGTAKISDVRASTSLPNVVTYEDLDSIKWTARIAGAAAISAGTSTHDIYVTLKDPKGTVYFTPLDITSTGASKAKSDAKVIEGVWGEFSDFPRVGDPPELRRREFDPKTGKINRTTGAPIRYYSDIATGDTFEQSHAKGFACGAFFDTAALLKNAQGRCGAWANFMVDSLAIQGVGDSSKGLATVQGLVTKSGVGEPCPEPAAGQNPDCPFLIKDWKFKARNAAPQVANFPYDWDQVTDEKGIPGQSVKNPQPWFTDHAIVKVTTTVGRTQIDKFYDPSYGKGPFDSILEYDIASIAGFCVPVPATAPKQYACQQNESTAGAKNAGVLGLVAD